jgi:hypothetical protein
MRFVFAILLVGCGQVQESPVLLALPALQLQAGTCSATTELKAFAAIGGHPDCELEVGADRKPVGTCADITVGLTRPICIVYYEEGTSARANQLAFLAGAVDLRREKLSGSPEQVQVTIGKADTTYVGSPADIAALPDEDEVDSDLDLGRNFCKKLIEEKGFGLDCDGDETTNIDEWCSDTLGDCL